MLYNLFENRDFVSVFAVALLAEGVDRNHDIASYKYQRRGSPSSRRAWIEILWIRPDLSGRFVALLAEGVDRNCLHRPRCPGGLVALLAEGVDRNKRDYSLLTTMNESPSSRRAWIEMAIRKPGQIIATVALLAEGVDRNRLTRCRSERMQKVALLAEGVDRNRIIRTRGSSRLRRPPRGGRG